MDLVVCTEVVCELVFVSGGEELSVLYCSVCLLNFRGTKSNKNPFALASTK